MNNIALMWKMLRDPSTPLLIKIIAVVTPLYLISPIDFIPDFIPVLGWMDDAGAVLTTAITLLVRLKQYKALNE